MVATLWNQQMQSNRPIHNHKPENIICDDKKGTCMLIDVAVLGDIHVMKKEAEKILK
jgi:hypothetical protein